MSNATTKSTVVGTLAYCVVTIAGIPHELTESLCKFEQAFQPDDIGMKGYFETDGLSAKICEALLRADIFETFDPRVLSTIVANNVMREARWNGLHV